ncbi:esterase/lipase family protein [Luteimonas huabeiensis]|uniref:esterase/lipase family protein n=1 Tax=Luteimonas huabeiensis TaxID=1244513 RepID=UPI00046510DB|nr:alpha/beta fold hydrolase [Luteimonas huabeiensis]
MSPGRRRPAPLRRGAVACARGLLAAAAVLLLGGCAVLREFGPSVEVRQMSAGEYIALKRGDLLTQGTLSAATRETLQVAGLDEGPCAQPGPACIQALADAEGLTAERRQSALSELWLQRATLLPAGDRAMDDARLDAWLETARHAYAYLFFSERPPDARAFEDRQTQVRDWYNHAVQQAVTQLFDARAHEAAAAGGDALEARRAGWTLRVDLRGVRMPEGVDTVRELLPASSLSFQGLRSVYRRDGFGAELVAVMDDPVTAPAAAPAPAPPRAPDWSEMPFPALTVLLRFEGDDLDAVLRTRRTRMSVHDPYVDAEVDLRGQRVPLAANFTAGYGLWLARSGFSRQSLRTLFGREHGIARPHLYMMQPYDPDRRIVLMLHGLASSPEAWVNLANEILGDETLRQRFQIWQVYYPTNAPIALNHAAIRRTVSDALDRVDPFRLMPASRDIVLIGHSMGGVISRLMVSSAGDRLWDAVLAEREPDPDRLARARPRLQPVLGFAPFPGVERAIFIAAPHRGTAVAGSRAGRFLSRLVRLPITVLEGFGDALQALAGEPGADEPRLPNSIDNLDANDPFVRAAADLPISPSVRYHSIVARASAAGALEDSDDGLVPYRSAHLPGAVSERVIVSGHSVQRSAEAILEIRRILHEDLRESGDAPARAPLPGSP